MPKNKQQLVEAIQTLYKLYKDIYPQVPIFTGEIYKIQLQLLAFFAETKNKEKYQEIWTDFKKTIGTEIQDVMHVRRHMIPVSDWYQKNWPEIYNEIEQEYKRVFFINFANDERLYNQFK